MFEWEREWVKNETYKTKTYKVKETPRYVMLRYVLHSKQTPRVEFWIKYKNNKQTERKLRKKNTVK